jgi:hypothetical protein
MEVEQLKNVPIKGIGRPDYSAPNPTNSANLGLGWSSSDIAELSARQGSPDVYDRRGNVIFIDNFGDGIDNYVYVLGAGAGAAREWRADVYDRGGFSLRLSGGVGTASSFSRQWNTLNPGKIGVEISAAIPATGLFASLSLISYFFDGANVHQMGLLFNPATATLSIYDSTGGLQVIGTGGSMAGVVNAFSAMKLVIDFANDRYVRVLMNQGEKDLSKYKGRVTPFVSGVFASFVGTIQSRPTFNDYISIGSVIVSQNEPNNT